MRIILATPIYPPEIGGPATYTKELATRLSKTEKVTVVAYADQGEPVEGVNLILVSKSQNLFARLTQFFFTLVREAKNADIIYVQNAVAAGLPAVLAGALVKKPVVLKFVGDEAWERATQTGKTVKNLEDFLTAPEGGFKTSIFIAIQKFVLARVSAVVPPSAFLGNILKKYYGIEESKLTVNYNAFEGTVVSRMAAKKPHQILSVSRLTAWKHIDGIINALKIIKNSYPSAVLVVAGEGPEEANLKNLAAQMGLQNSITFTGRVSREQVNELMSESGVSVLNSTYEGLPHIALENFALGVPLIATDIPGTREAVIDKQTGLLVPPGDDATLAVAIDRVFQDEALRERLVAGGRELLKSKFSWEGHLQTLLAVFASLNHNKN